MEEQHEISEEELQQKLSALEQTMDAEASDETLIALIHQLVPTYLPRKK